MITRELLGTAQVPGGEELRLFAHGRDFIIALGRNELMSTRMRGSEEALATLTLERLAAPAPRLLVGGYGMGFTLRAALAAHSRAHITVAELVPEIVAWARGPMAALTAGCLDDPRVTLAMADVGDAIAAARAALRTGGVLAVWSAGKDPAFSRRLRAAGFVVDEVEVRARANGKGPRHTIWFACKR